MCVLLWRKPAQAARCMQCVLCFCRDQPGATLLVPPPGKAGSPGPPRASGTRGTAAGEAVCTGQRIPGCEYSSRVRTCVCGLVCVYVFVQLQDKLFDPTEDYQNVSIVSMYMFVHMCVCVRVCTRVYVYVFVCVCLHLCMCTCL